MHGRKITARIATRDNRKRRDNRSNVVESPRWLVRRFAVHVVRLCEEDEYRGAGKREAILAVSDVIPASKSHLWRAWIEPWFLSYAFLGASVAGLAPILLPLSVGKSGSVADIGLVVGAFNLGGLSAPLWGTLADRKGLHRLLLISGLLGAAITLAVFPFTTSLAARIALALAQGVGAASAATVANLFIIEVHPKPEWDERIGWLQTFYGGGQVLGLLLAGFVGGTDLKLGFLIAAGITAAACIPALYLKGKVRTASFARPALTHPPRHSGFSAGSPQSFYHQFSFKAFKHLFRSFASPLGIFLFAWLISFAGAAAFFSLYPILMKQVYGVEPSLSSVGFAIAAAAGMLLYAPAGTWSRKYGPMRVLRAALVVRVVAFVVLLIVGVVNFEAAGPIALVSFVLVVVAWSLMSVSGTEITAQFSEANEGEGLGLFNASTAIAGVIGAVIGGWSAGMWGYNMVAVLGIVGVSGALFLTSIVNMLGKNEEQQEKA
jgi:DHA1 family tetracycline resistance protein-like MFS transporter